MTEVSDRASARASARALQMDLVFYWEQSD